MSVNKTLKYIILQIIRISTYLFLRNVKINIVTGASSNHFKSLFQLINSIKLIEKRNFDIIAYDLGLKK